MPEFQYLFTPITIGSTDHQEPGHLLLGACHRRPGRSMACPTNASRRYYEEKARGGVGFNDVFWVGKRSPLQHGRAGLERRGVSSSKTA